MARTKAKLAAGFSETCRLGIVTSQLTRPLTLTKRIFPACISRPLRQAARPIKKNGWRVSAERPAWERPDHEALPNGVLAGCRDIQFAKPRFAVHCACVTT